MHLADLLLTGWGIMLSLWIVCVYSASDSFVVSVNYKLQK